MKLNQIVGTSGVSLDAETIEAAIRLAGPEGTLILHPEQAAQLGGDLRWRVIEDADVPSINGGADWCGRYVGTAKTIDVCSRRTPSGAGG